MEKQTRATPCGLCGRDVATRYALQRRLVNSQPHGADKERVPHKCPHGVWCPRGGTPGKSKLNLRTHHTPCPDCAATLREVRRWERQEREADRRAQDAVAGGV